MCLLGKYANSMVVGINRNKCYAVNLLDWLQQELNTVVTPVLEQAMQSISVFNQN